MVLTVVGTITHPTLITATTTTTEMAPPTTRVVMDHSATIVALGDHGGPGSGADSLHHTLCLDQINRLG